jgi:outer membrane protein TolC
MLKRLNAFLILPLAVCICALTASCTSEPAKYPSPDALSPSNAIAPDNDGSLPADDMNFAKEFGLTGKEPLKLEVKSTLLIALRYNPGFSISRIQPRKSMLDLEAQKSAFDPVLSASASAGRTSDRVGGPGGPENSSGTTSESASVGVSKYLESGATLEATLSQSARSNDGGGASDSRDASLDVKMTQALLQGAGSENTLAQIRQAELNVEISKHELRAAAETLIAQAEQAYWDYVLAGRSIEIYTQSVEVAENQVAEVKERINVGKLPETELAAAEAEAAGAREQLITARGELAKKRINLIRILSSGGTGGIDWNREVQAVEEPETTVAPLDNVESHVELAMKNRSDLNQARLEVKVGDIEIARTKNGLLPKLDFFVEIGGSLYTDSFAGFGGTRGDGVSFTTGLNLQMPFENISAKTQHNKALLSLKEAHLALVNMEQLAQVDVRSAYVEVTSAGEKAAAAKLTRINRETVLNAEQEKFRVGKSTAFLVSQAQRDLVSSRINEIQAIISYRTALMNLYRLEGTLLERRGIKTQ